MSKTKKKISGKTVAKDTREGLKEISPNYIYIYYSPLIEECLSCNSNKKFEINDLAVEFLLMSI